MRIASAAAVLAMLLRTVVNAGSDPTVRASTNTNDIVAVTLPRDDAAFNLLDRSVFFVCDSLVDGMDGRYVLYEDSSIQSDADTPVFVREDDDEEGLKKTLAVAGQIQDEHDFRLFRRNGFWMFADVAPWPPATIFRCDPTKTHELEVDFAGICGMGLDTPPLLGYSPVDAEHRVPHLVLRTASCGVQGADGPALKRVLVVQTNLSGRKDEL
jgi:hypothetical protein